MTVVAGCGLGAQPGLSNGASVYGLSVELGFLTAWQLGFEGEHPMSVLQWAKVDPVGLL